MFAIYISADDPGPAVLCTAVDQAEEQRLLAWLHRCPALGDLVDRAVQLAGDADADPDSPVDMGEAA